MVAMNLHQEAQASHAASRWQDVSIWGAALKASAAAASESDDGHHPGRLLNNPTFPRALSFPVSYLIIVDADTHEFSAVRANRTAGDLQPRPRHPD